MDCSARCHHLSEDTIANSPLCRLWRGIRASCRGHWRELFSRVKWCELWQIWKLWSIAFPGNLQLWILTPRWVTTSPCDLVSIFIDSRTHRFSYLKSCTSLAWKKCNSIIFARTMLNNMARVMMITLQGSIFNRTVSLMSPTICRLGVTVTSSLSGRAFATFSTKKMGADFEVADVCQAISCQLENWFVSSCFKLTNQFSSFNAR